MLFVVSVLLGEEVTSGLKGIKYWYCIVAMQPLQSHQNFRFDNVSDILQMKIYCTIMVIYQTSAGQLSSYRYTSQ